MMFGMLSKLTYQAMGQLDCLPAEARVALEERRSWDPVFDDSHVHEISAPRPYYCNVTNTWIKASFFTTCSVRAGVFVNGLYQVDNRLRITLLETIPMIDLRYPEWESRILEKYSDNSDPEWDNYLQWCYQHGSDPLGQLKVNDVDSKEWEALVVESDGRLYVHGIKLKDQASWDKPNNVPIEVLEFLCIEDITKERPLIRKNIAPEGIDQLITIPVLKAGEVVDDENGRNVFLTFVVDHKRNKQTIEREVIDAARSALQAA